ANDTPRDQSRNLLEDHARTAVIYDERVLLVLGRGRFEARHFELSRRVMDVANHAAHGAAVHMDVEDIQENAHTMTVALDGANLYDFAVSRRNSDGTSGNLALRIAEEVETKQTRSDKRQRRHRLTQPRQP